jgi:hypothetical protein
MALNGSEDPTTLEVFARFGHAFYMANVVEDQLVMTLLQLEFARTKEAFVKAKGQGFDRTKIAAEWDAYEKKQRGKMMGELRKLVEDSTDFSRELKDRIKTANDRRNHLAHSYWPEQALTMQTKEGRDKMIAELIADADMFEKLAADIQAAMRPVREKLGVKDEVLDAGVETQMAQMREGQGLPLK